jgi:hypothetical protein
VKNLLQRHWRVLPPVLVVVVLWVAWGCNQNSTTPTPAPQPEHVPLAVTISQATDTLTVGSTLPLSATIVGWSTDSTVSWSIIGVGVPVGTMQAQLGTMQCTGLTATYTAPATLSATTLSIQVRVRSNQDTLDVATCSILVMTKPVVKPNVSILVNPISSTLQIGQPQQFQATVSGSTNTGVRWELVSGPGTISSTGQYTAPAYMTDTSASAIIEALWLGDTTVTGHSVVTIESSGPCFRTQILPIFISNCALGCHNPVNLMRGFDFTNYEGIMEIVVPGDTAGSVLYYRTNHFVTLTDADRALLAQWILAGAPNSQCEPDMSSCNTENISYSSYIQPTIATYCLGCHSYKWAGEYCDSLDFTNYPTVADEAQNGALLDVIQHKYPLPAMPYYGPQLDACTIAKIAAWVNNGAPNN